MAQKSGRNARRVAVALPLFSGHFRKNFVPTSDETTLFRRVSGRSISGGIDKKLPLATL
jgi:hypothetical protein